MYEHICRRCNQTFESKNSVRVYCSQVCKTPPNHRECVGCGDRFHVAPSNRQRFCTVVCKKRFWSKRTSKLSSYAEAFWRKVDVRGLDECWLWQGAINNNGYGQFSYSLEYGSRKLAYAHRLSYNFHYNVDPGEKEVMHTCDTPACVNPKHLKLGTHGDNMRDMARKLRSGNGIFTSQEILEIRGSKLSTKDMARAFSVAESTILRIRAQNTYRWVT